MAAFQDAEPGPFRGRLLEYLEQLTDPRTLPALLAALDDEALVEPAAHVLARADWLGLDGRAEATQVVAAHLAQAEPDSHRVLSLIAALVRLGDAALATPALADVAVSPDSPHDFHVRRVAMESLGALADPMAAEAAIVGLFVFGADPTERMDDVASCTLVRIGRPAIAPLLRVLTDEDAAARAAAEAFVEAARAQSPDTTIDADDIRVQQAATTLGTLGDPAAFDGLLAVAESDDPSRAVPAVIALSALDLDDARREQVRRLLESRYQMASLEAKAQLLEAMRARIDPASLPFLSRVARSRRADEVLRVLAFHAATFVALGAEASALKSIRLPDRSATESREPVLELAVRCAEDIECWLAEAGSEHVDVQEKVAYALGRLGQGDERARSSLFALLRHPEVRVRLAALVGLDRIGAGEEAVRVIEALGQDALHAFATRALPAAARFEARARRGTPVSEARVEGAAPKGGARGRHRPRAVYLPRR